MYAGEVNPIEMWAGAMLVGVGSRPQYRMARELLRKAAFARNWLPEDDAGAINGTCPPVDRAIAEISPLADGDKIATPDKIKVDVVVALQTRGAFTVRRCVGVRAVTYATATARCPRSMSTDGAVQQRRGPACAAPH